MANMNLIGVFVTKLWHVQALSCGGGDGGATKNIISPKFSNFWDIIMMEIFCHIRRVLAIIMILISTLNMIMMMRTIIIYVMTHNHNCDTMACNIWNWAIEHKVWLSATHLPGKLNIKADRLSRNLDRSKEWSLNEHVFRTLVEIWPSPQIDLFASRLNNKLEAYISWLPDPYAISIYAFVCDWENNYSYIFPPFGVIAKCLQKIQADTAEAMIIAPLWPTHTHGTSHRPTDNYSSQERSSAVTQTHTLHPTLILMACRVSGSHSKIIKKIIKGFRIHT